MNEQDQEDKRLRIREQAIAIIDRFYEDTDSDSDLTVKSNLVELIVNATIDGIDNALKDFNIDNSSLYDLFLFREIEDEIVRQAELDYNNPSNFSSNGLPDYNIDEFESYLLDKKFRGLRNDYVRLYNFIFYIVKGCVHAINDNNKDDDVIGNTIAELPRRKIPKISVVHDFNYKLKHKTIPELDDDEKKTRKYLLKLCHMVDFILDY